MRLAKYLAAAGIASRRKAEEYIDSGRIMVNGKVISGQGAVIDPDADDVRFDGNPVQCQQKVYFLLNKPTGYICSIRDDFGRPIVTELIKEKTGRIYPVGRLDMDTEGLLLLTNDGDFAHKVLHPRYNLPRKYVAMVQGVVTRSTVKRLKEGIWLENEFSGPVKVSLLIPFANTSELHLEIYSGKKRIIRRLLKKAGHPVIKLKRVAWAFLNLEGLETGAYRALDPDEIHRLINWSDRL